MKRLLLLPLVAIGLALVPAKQTDAQVSVGVGGVGIGFGYPAYRYSYYSYPGYYPYGYYGGYPYYRDLLLRWAAVLLQRPPGLPTPQASSQLLSSGWCESGISWLGRFQASFLFV